MEFSVKIIYSPSTLYIFEIGLVYSSSLLTSNFSFDKVLQIGALGFSNGMIKLYRVLYTGEEFGPKGNW